MNERRNFKGVFWYSALQIAQYKNFIPYHRVSMVTGIRTFEVEFHLDLFDWSARRASASKYCYCKPIDSALPKDNDITVRLIS
ncbi:hypothetical protein CEXT_419491 [Caerostris extrusa]|uniref:MJ1316 RNA cyclic group end recognition domain-containing protein n=1 Tax=Caerostris extrusa TaxID=172846 RepID=A0AAV4NBP0_CAEEX|nr:hypothetical protein CEXT_419491 [Caerostris extrusa]